MNVDPTVRAKDLAVEQRQFVEIARALSFGARLIILDEPTAQLDARGIQRLFTKLRELQSQGVAFLFISHHLQEVYELCTTVTVYRDARHIAHRAGRRAHQGRPGRRDDRRRSERHVRLARTRGPACATRNPYCAPKGWRWTGEFEPLDLEVTAR